MENHEFIKASGAIQIANLSENALTLQQMKTWNVLLANAWHSLKKEEVHSIHLLDLMRYLGENHNNWAALKDNFRALAGVRVEWNIMNKDREVSWGIATLLSQAEIVNSTTLEYAYPPKIRDLLADPRIFARLSLLQQSVLKSKYSLILYEICTDYKGVKQTPLYPLDEFRRIMGIKDGEYPEFKRFSQRVIKAPIGEVNKKTPLTISAEYQRENRAVVAIKFHIEEKKDFVFERPEGKGQMSLPLSNEDITETIPRKKIPDNLQTLSVPEERLPAFQTLIEAGLREDDAKAILHQYDDEHIASNLRYVLERLHGSARQQVKNPKAYLITAIRDDYAKDDREREKSRKARKTKKQEEERAWKAKEELNYYQKEYASFVRYRPENLTAYKPPSFASWLREEFGIIARKSGKTYVLSSPSFDPIIGDLLERHSDDLDADMRRVPYAEVEDAKAKLQDLSVYESFRLLNSEYAIYDYPFLCKLAELLPKRFHAPADLVAFAKESGVNLERIGEGSNPWDFRVISR